MISIVIPAYNASETIINAVKSISSQTYKNWELIIVDDGSKDNTVKVLNTFFKTLSQDEAYKIRLIQQGNQGPSVARNTGIELAKGKYIAFLDSDDVWLDTKLETQMEYIEKDESIYLCSTGFGKKRVKCSSDSRTISFKELLFKNYFTTTTVLVRAEVFEKYKFDTNQKYSEDYKLWLLIAYDYKCIYIKKVLAVNPSDKLDYGDSGLSSNLWKMEKGEISNFVHLYKHKRIGFFKLMITTAFSFFKYIRRVLVVTIKNV
jgi:glycosyltransferase involved in cell wall biosynthesis